jgi:ATP adenylyltransferase
MSLEQLWAGWRHEYVTSATAAERTGGTGSAPGSADGTCVFCRLAACEGPSEENGVVWRGRWTFTVLNAYPYASGHLLVMPLRHVGALEALTDDEADELWSATRTAVSALTAAYEPDGLNVGANLGRAAGAGIPAHLHLHALPRWSGDTNFMTSVGGVRVLPETLPSSWRRLRAAWPGADSTTGTPPETPSGATTGTPSDTSTG